MGLVPLPGPLRPREYVMLGGPPHNRIAIGMRLPEGPWLNVTEKLTAAKPLAFTDFPDLLRA